MTDKRKIKKVVAKILPKKKAKEKNIEYKVKYVTDNPSYDTIKENEMIIVGGKGYVKWAYFKCPSGCGEVIVLSLVKGDHDNWKLRVDKEGRPTLSPSVSKDDGCRSHFFIRKGKVTWARSYFFDID